MKVILLFVFTMMLGITVNAQSKEKSTGTPAKAKTSKVAVNDAKASTVDGTAMAQPAKQERPHVCSEFCQNGKHVYQHFEKGHVCGPECKRKADAQKKTKSK